MKNLKKLLCLVLTVLICFSLVGCNLIDEMRDAQIYFNENENPVYAGQEYKPLPECAVFSPDMEDSKSLYITDTDVPVLLSEILGTEVVITKDNRFMYIENEDYDTDYSVIYYARADVYDDIAARIESGNYYDGLCYYYETYDGDSDSIWQTHHQTISKKAEAAFKDIVENYPPDDIDIDLLYQFSVTDLWACSSDLLFKEYCATIYKTEEHIYLTAIINGRFESEVVFTIPEEYTEIFKELINDYYEAEITYDEWWAESVE